MSDLNFSIAYPDITWDALTIDASADANFPVRNLFYNGSGVVWKRSGTATSTNITFDLGNTKKSSANYCILRGINNIVHQQGDKYGVTVEVRASLDNFASSNVLVSSQNPIELVGTKDEDAILLFTRTYEYRYWRVVIVTDTAIQHQLRKLFIGNLFNFDAVSPHYPYRSKYQETGNAFVSDRGTLFKSSNGKKQRSLEINWRNVLDSTVDFFKARMVESKDDSPFCFVHKDSMHNPLTVYKKPKTLSDFEPVALYDASDLSKLFTLDSGGSLPAYGVGVGRWETSFGAAHATQSTSGSRPIRSTEPITGIRNRWERSDPSDATGISASNLTYSSGNISGFSSEAFFGDNTLSRTLIKGAATFVPVLVNGEAYRFSYFIRMSDGLAPNLTAATAAERDYVFLRNNSESVGHTMENLGGGIYRMTHTWTQGSTASVGIRKNTTSSNRTFWATGFHVQLSSETNLVYQKNVTRYEVYESGIANRDYLWFDGTDDLLSANGLATTIGQGNDTPFTIISLVGSRSLPGATAQVIWSFGDSTSTNFRHNLNYLTSGGVLQIVRRDSSTTATLDSTLPTPTTPQVQSMTFRGTAASIHMNGELGITGALDVATMGTAPNLFGIGAMVRSTVSNWTPGNYYALAIFNKALSDSDRSYVEHLLSEQFSIASISAPENTNPNLLTAWVREYDISSGENANLNDVSLSLLEDII